MRPQYPYQRSANAPTHAPTNGMSTPFQRGVFQPPLYPPGVGSRLRGLLAPLAAPPLRENSPGTSDAVTPQAIHCDDGATARLTSRALERSPTGGRCLSRKTPAARTNASDKSQTVSAITAAIRALA
jgi:hypothetical protein